MEAATTTLKGQEQPTVPPRKAPAAASPPRRPYGAPTWLRVGLSILLILMLLGIALTVFQALTSMKEEPVRETPPPRVLRVEAFLTERTDLDHFVTSYGVARAHREVVVAAEVAGRITYAPSLKVGRAIRGATPDSSPDQPAESREADIIVQIDPQTYEERVQQFQAQLEQDQASLARIKQETRTTLKLIDQVERQMETLKRDYVRRQQLLEQGAGSETELERAKLQVDQYRETQIKLQNDLDLQPIREAEILAQTNAHRNDLQLAKLELEKATVRAPFNGVFSEVFVEEGQYVRPGDTLVRLTDVEWIEIPIPLSLSKAALVERLLQGGHTPVVQLAQREWDFTTPGAQVWEGVIRRVSPVADELTRTVQVYVEVHNEIQTTPLRPGAFTYARIRVERIPGTRGLIVPRDSLVNGHLYVVEPRPSSPQDAAEVGGSSASALPEARASRRRVTVMETYQTFALVEGELHPGDRVVMTNLDIIFPDVLLDVRTLHTLTDELQRLRVPSLQPAGSE